MKRILLFATVAALALVSCKKEETVTPEIKADKTEYTLPLEGTEETAFYVEFTSNIDWTAALKETAEWISFSPKKGVAGNGKIKIVAEANSTNDPRTAVLVVTAGTAQKEYTLTQPQKNAFSLVESSAELDSKGGTVAIKVMTNVAYTVTIPSDVTWITKADTKAYGEQTTNLTIAAYDELDGERSAEISVSADGFDALTFTITQSGPQTKLWSVDMTTAIERSASVTLGTVSDYTSMVSVAILGDKLVVCQGDGSAPVLLDKKTGEKKGTLSTGDFKVFAVTNDDAGNLIISNRNAYDFGTYWWTCDFEVYYMTSETSDPVKLVSKAQYGPIGSVLVAKGDVSKDGIILAPYEGIPTFSAANQVEYWNIKDGKAEDSVKLTLTDFVGLSWANGYWNMAPANIPAIALFASDISKGGIFGVYGENALYLFDGAGKCSLLQADVADGNHCFNSADIKTINGKSIVALCAGAYYPEWALTANVALVDFSTGEIIAVLETETYAFDSDGNYFSGIAAGTDVVLEEADGGVNVYYIANNESAIEAFYYPLK